MKLAKYQNPNLSEAIPELAPEVIADQVTPDKKMQSHLCDRLRRHWLMSQSFRRLLQTQRPPRRLPDVDVPLARGPFGLTPEINLTV